MRLLLRLHVSPARLVATTTAMFVAPVISNAVDAIAVADIVSCKAGGNDNCNAYHYDKFKAMDAIIVAAMVCREAGGYDNDNEYRYDHIQCNGCNSCGDSCLPRHWWQ